MSFVQQKFLVANSVLNAARQHAARIVYREADRSYDFATHIRLAEGTATELAKTHGVSAGDRVAVLANTSQPYIALWHAATMGRFIIVPLNTRLAARELADLLDDAQAAVLVHDDDFAALAAEAVELAAAHIAPVPMRRLADRPADLTAIDGVCEDDPVAILYTGGTTGRSKGVVMTQKGFGILTHRLHFLWDLFPPDTCLYGTAALYHVSANNLYLGPALAGNCTVLPPRFDMALLVEDVRRHKVTHIILIAAMIDRFLDTIRNDAASYQHIRYIGYGGAPVSAATITELLRLLPNAKIQQSYGMTEVMGGATQLIAQDHVTGGDLLRSAGRALPGCEIETRAPDNTPCARGGIGEIFLRIDTMMAGYWRAPEQTASVLRDGWYRTGDVGYLDEAGYLYLVDRVKDMIVTGGENVYSIEVERALETLPGVRQAAVIGIPSAQWGEQVHAFVVHADDPAPTAEALRHGLAALIGRYKIPKSFELTTQPLPMTANNKVAKAELRRRFWGDRQRQIN